MDFKKLDTLVDSCRDEFLESLGRWMKIPSVPGKPETDAPFGREIRSMLDTALADARDYGFSTRCFDGFVGDVTLGCGEKTLGILCHLDVVPAGEGWTVEPFRLTRRGSDLLGRGVIDNKGPALAALFAMRCVRDAGFPMKDTVRLIYGCDEESAMSDMEHYKKCTAAPDYGFSPDSEYSVVNTEKGAMHLRLTKETGGEDGAQIPVYELYAGEQINVVAGTARAVIGVTEKNKQAVLQDIREIACGHNFRLYTKELDEHRLELTAEGLSAHASAPQMGKNAAGMLLTTLANLKAGGGSRKSIELLAETIGMTSDGNKLGIAASDDISGALTCNLGIMRYDGLHLCLDLDIRFPLCTNEEKICGQMAIRVSSAQIAVTRIDGYGAHHVPAEHFVVQKLLKTYRDISGRDDLPHFVGGNTYSRHMPNTVAFGPRFPEMKSSAHMPDESIPLETLMTCMRAIAHAIVDLAGCEVESSVNP